MYIRRYVGIAKRLAWQNKEAPVVYPGLPLECDIRLAPYTLLFNFNVFSTAGRPIG